MPLNFLSGFLLQVHPNGTILWGNSFNSVYNLQDIAHRVVVSTSTLIIGGASQSSISPVSWRLTRLSFNLNTGSLVGSAYTGADNSELDEISDLIIDSAESIYVCGSKNVFGQGKNLRIIKYNNSLVEQWVYEKNGAVNEDDHAFSLVQIDNSNIGFTGYTHTGDGKKAIIGKLNAINGVSLWVTEWTGYEALASEGYKIVKNLSNDLYVAANDVNQFNQDVALLKLSQSNGAILAQGFFNGDSNGHDAVYAMAINGGNIFISTQTEKGVGFSYALVKWREQTVYLPNNFGAQSSQGYEINNGQVRNAQGLSDTQSKYYNYTSYPSTFLLSNQRMSMVFTNRIDENTVSAQRIDMGFKNANTVSDWVPIKLMPSFTNYYLTHMNQPSLKTEMFSGVVWKEIYPNVDLMFTQNELAYKYYFVIRSGANIANIKSEYSGHSSIGVGGDGKLKIGLNWTTEEQERPVAYSMNNLTGVLTQHSWQPTYVVTGNDVSFGNIGAWSGTLVIEINAKAASSLLASCPGTNNIEWSTFFGGSSDDELKGVDVNPGNEAFVVGITLSANIPDVGSTLDLSSESFNQDFLIGKFREDCSAAWVTIYGGASFDLGFDIAWADNDRVHVTGVTGSNGLGLWADGGLDDIVKNGNRDGLYLKLTGLDGEIDVDTYIGGNGLDNFRGISLVPTPKDGPRRLYLTGHTSSGQGWEMMASDPESLVLPYSQNEDGVILCINDSDPNQPVMWGTFFGTTENDYLWDVVASVDPQALYLVGTTESLQYGNIDEVNPPGNQFPLLKQSADFSFTPVNPNAANYFFIKYGVTLNGNVPIHSLDYSTFVYETTNDGDDLFQRPSLGVSRVESQTGERQVYVTGIKQISTSQSATFPIVGSGWQQQSFGQGSQGFIMKLTHNTVFDTFQLTWSTLFGGNNEEAAFSSHVSPTNELTITGTHRSTAVQQPGGYCQSNPTAFPLCNSDGGYHIETNISAQTGRSLAATFDLNNDILWSTQLGCGEASEGHSVKTTDFRGWIVGEAREDYTLLDFDGAGTTAYFKGFNPLNEDGVITRFNKSPVITEVEIIAFDKVPEINLFPNPASNLVNISIERDFNDATLKVFDATGRLILDKTLNSRTEIVEINEWANGVYSFVITLDGQVLSKLLIKN
jgi:hypothetical protein